MATDGTPPGTAATHAWLRNTSDATVVPGPHPVQPLDAMTPDQRRAFLKGYMGDWRPLTGSSRGQPEPPDRIPRDPAEPCIALPLPDMDTYGALPVGEAIPARRSRHTYAETALDLNALSALLWCTQGIRHIDENTGATFRTVPSAGARHPFETYVIALRVDGAARAIYRYVAHEHVLTRTQEPEGLDDALVTACYDAHYVARAAAVFVWTAIPARTQWAYGPLSERMIAMEAGHICQNLYLTAESMGAATCALLSYNQHRMDALLDVDGENEFTVCMAPVGKRADDPE